MSAKLNVYNLGKLGVNVDKNPIQLQDGELTEAQNWTTDSSGSEGGLRKRPGLVAINASALGSGTSILGAIDVPLANRQTTTRTFYIGIDQDATGAYQWVTSTDAFATTATATSPGAMESQGVPATPLDPAFYGRIVSTETLLIYPGNHVNYPTASHTAPSIRVFDGTVDRQVALVPNNISESATGNAIYVYDMIKSGDYVYFIVHDGTTGSSFRSRVLRMNLSTYGITQVGEKFGPGTGELGSGTRWALSLAFHNGFLFVGTGFGSSGTGVTPTIYRIRPDLETTWTLDGTFAAEESIMSLASYNGRLFAGTMIDSAAVGRLLVRSVAGVWAESTNTGGAPTGLGNGWTGLTVFGTNLYACRLHLQGASSATSIHRFDDTTWTNVFTIQSGDTGADKGVAGLVHNGRLYFVCHSSGDGRVVHSTTGASGSWTAITTHLTPGGSSRFGGVRT